MRLIDADALTNDILRRWNTNDDTDFANKEVWKALKEAPTINAVPRWIPCEERLPELNKVILISDGKAVHLGYYSDLLEGVIGKKVFITKYLDVVITNAIAWMPLPEPYGEERKDDEIHKNG